MKTNFIGITGILGVDLGRRCSIRNVLIIKNYSPLCTFIASKAAIKGGEATRGIYLWYVKRASMLLSRRDVKGIVES